MRAVSIVIDRSCCTPCVYVCIHTCAQAWRLFIDSISSYLLLVSEELDVETLKGILTDFALRMGVKWEVIGIKLRQGYLVQELRASPQLGRQKVLQIFDEWLGNEGNCKDVPACVATMSRVLRSEGVGLDAVAKDFEEVRPLRCVWPLKRDDQPRHSFNRHEHLLTHSIANCLSVLCPYSAIGGAKEGRHSACCFTAFCLIPSTRSPSWCVPSCRSVCAE